MGTEVKEILEPSKSTVMVRFNLRSEVHAECMSIHKDNPNSMNFTDSMAEIVEEGAKVVKAKRAKEKEAIKMAMDSETAFHMDESRQRQEDQTR